MKPEDIEIRLFLEGIYAAYGYDLRRYAPASIRRRVLSALAASGCAHLGELLHRVLHDESVFAGVLDALTVRVTEPFRDPAVLLAFRTRVVPLLRTYPALKIWSAGCATGEEAYTTAIMLAESGLEERTQVYATDLSQRALDQAKDGIYPASMRDTLERNHALSGGSSDLSRWFLSAYDQVAIREPLRSRVLFFHHDLVADHVFGEMNVIFCRNVLIYFDQELRRDVLAKLAQSLCPGGFLCLGSSERLLPSPASRSFTPFDEDHRIYRYEP